MRPSYYNQNLSFILDEVALNAIVGIHDYERFAPQQLIFSLSAELSHAHAVPSVQAIIKDYCRKHKPLLLERMAYDLAHSLLDKAWFIKSLSLTIKKPNALLHAQCSFVTIDVARN